MTIPDSVKETLKRGLAFLQELFNFCFVREFFSVIMWSARYRPPIFQIMFKDLWIKNVLYIASNYLERQHVCHLYLINILSNVRYLREELQNILIKTL